MNSTPWSKLTALVLLHALLAAPFAFAQQEADRTTRPRRAIGAEPTAPQIEPAPGGPGMTVRIGLATNANSVSISSASSLRSSADEVAPLVLLAASRVRLEPRRLSPVSPPPPSPNNDFVLEVAGVLTKEAAALAARDIAEAAGEQTVTAFDGATATWKVTAKLPARQPPEIEELRAQLENAGYGAVSVRSNNAAAYQPATAAATNKPPARGGAQTRLVSRPTAPTREVVAYSAAASTPLLTARTPVVFAADDESQTPLKFNDKLYRGRLEVFANSRGSLTVVNVIDLEDYVRGVVPNELSPGVYPEIEALKAQAVAARTYAVASRGLFAAQGFDLLPTTRSQVYRGYASEHPLTDRAVRETRGLIVTSNGRPINALYTATCGGHTEHAEHIFGGSPAQTAHLRARECAAEHGAHGLRPFQVRTSREPSNPRHAEHANSARDAALLLINNFPLPARISDSWLAEDFDVDEAREILSAVARLSRHQTPSSVDGDTVRPGGWCRALALALDGESRADVLLDRASLDYLLSFRDADDVAAGERPDVALFLREGWLSLFPDGSLNPRQKLSRARALRVVARALEARNLLGLQKAVARPAANGALVVRAGDKAGRNAERTLTVAPDALLFRAFGEHTHAAREIAVVGGEPVIYHANARGQVDYLEVRPAPHGAAADRFSAQSHWTTTLTAAQVLGRLAARASKIGALKDLRVVARGASRRALDLEIIGTAGTAHVRGGRIRSALGLREQLFVIDRHYDDAGRIASYSFVGRGWGHGVGLCQVGAYGLARAGWSYDRILQNYYTGVDLTKAYQ